MKKLSLLLSCAIFALSGCVKDINDCTSELVVPIEIPDASRAVTLPNELEDGVFSVGMFASRTFTAGGAWAVDATTVPSWCTITPMSGTAGEITLTFTVAEENGTWEPKIANVVVKASTGETGTIEVTQPDVEDGTVYVPANGASAAALAAVDIASFPTVKIVGYLNSDDFANLNAMTTLELLNLKVAHLDNDEIPANAFYVSEAPAGNQTLKSVIFPPTLKSIGAESFAMCTNFASLNLPVGLESIEDGAFYKCLGLTSLTLPEGVTTLGEYAFYGCSGLTSLTFNDGLVSIGDYAFGNCSKLTGDLILPSTLRTIGEGGFTQSYITLPAASTIVLPEGIESIGQNAFMWCRGFAGELIIPSTLTTIPQSAFWQVTGITKLTIREGVKIIGIGAFGTSSGITGELIIPEGVTTIEDGAFALCTGITSVTIPASVTTIANVAFGNCTGLRTFYSKALLPPGHIKVFEQRSYAGMPNYDITKDIDLFIPTGTTAAYSAQFWRADPFNYFKSVTEQP